MFPFSLTPLAVSYLGGSGLCGKLPGALVQADAPALPPNCSCAFNAPLESTCAALGDMYTAMGGPGWLMQAGWATAAAGGGQDYCTVFAGVRAARFVSHPVLAYIAERSHAPMATCRLSFSPGGVLTVPSLQA